MRKTPKIEDVDKPLVGRCYMVPCIQCEGRWWPVIGSWHEDAEDVGFSAYHFHHDIRFLHNWQLIFPAVNNDPALLLARVQSVPRPFERREHDPIPIVYRVRKMRREMPEFPTLSQHGTPIKFIGALEKRFKSHRMKCMVCPHRGMSLKGMPVKDGAVVCHGHGLKWNVETGELIKRTNEGAPKCL